MHKMNCENNRYMQIRKLVIYEICNYNTDLKG